ncbi:hypothetical protein RIR_jg22971.t1 [Rhizophagus irregularis DAOM 181602=DAOM 197198]|nr:hypothetical protein RIR_jg22971.t1 [Rhizophagus irregularis DAOM 181602=DAOM 197198]
MNEERIRTLLSQQYEAIEARKRKSYKDISEKSNRKTKPFFRFSYGISGFYVGIYHVELKNPAILTKSTKAQRIRRDQFLKRGIEFENNKFGTRLIAGFCKVKFYKFKDFEANGRYKAASIVKKKLQLQMEKVNNLSTEVARLESMERIEHR